jgi:hypothetical protein
VDLIVLSFISSDCIASNATIVSAYAVGKRVEGSDGDVV